MAFCSLHRSPIAAEYYRCYSATVHDPATVDGGLTLNRNFRSAGNTILSCIATLALLASSSSAAQAQKATDEDPDGKEIAACTLSMDKIRHLTRAAIELKEWEQKNPDLAKGMDGDELKNAGSIAEQAKIIDTKFPQGTAIIKKNGFSTKEYLVALYAFIQAAMIVSFKRAGQAPDPDKLNGVVNPANLDLLEKNWEEIEKLNASLGSSPEKP